MHCTEHVYLSEDRRSNRKYVNSIRAAYHTHVQYCAVWWKQEVKQMSGKEISKAIILTNSPLKHNLNMSS